MATNLSKELSEIQAKLKAPKDNYNKFGEYKYRSCENILESVKPLLHEKGLSLVLSDELVLVGERHYVKATAKLLNGTEEIVVTASAREDESRKKMQPEQLTGSASSYARKYALSGLFCIDDNQDADSENQSKNGDDKGFGDETITEAQRKKINDDYIVTNLLTVEEIREILKSKGYKNSNEVKQKDYDSILSACDNKIIDNEEKAEKQFNEGKKK